MARKMRGMKSKEYRNKEIWRGSGVGGVDGFLFFA
jgi:hypothetical protein